MGKCDCPGQWNEPQFAAPVFCQVAALGLLMRADHLADHVTEAVHDVLAEGFPVRALEDDEKVIAADVADKIIAGVGDFADQPAQ